MSKFVVLTFLVACLGSALSAFPQTRGKGVVVVADEAHQRVDITIDGKRIQRTSGTDNKQQAQELHDRLKTDLWEQKRLGTKPRRTWQEAAVRYAEEKAEKTTLNTDLSHFRWLDAHLSDKYLDEISKDLIAEITKIRKLPYSIPRAKGPDREINPKPATVNRTLEIIRCVLRLARDDWEWIDHIPTVKLLKEATRRISWITREKAEELLNALQIGRAHV